MSSMFHRLANFQSALSSKSKMGRSLVGIVQMRSTDDVRANYYRCSELIEQCVERGAQMICLPENFAYQSTAAKDSNMSEWHEDPETGYWIS